MINQRFVRQPREALADALIAIAASLQDVEGSDEVLTILTDSLAGRGVACALFSQSGSDLQLERATMPLAPDSGGRPLRLTRLAVVLARGRPAMFKDVADACSESTGGERRTLLSDRVEGPLIAAPFEIGRGRQALLCVASKELSANDTAAVWGLALQVGAALRAVPANGHAFPGRPVSIAPAEDLSLFHELTRRFSYSLTDDEVVRTAVEVLAPALGFELAACVTCAGREDVTTVFGAANIPERLATSTAAGALDAFLKLTGKHQACARPPFRTLAFDRAPPPQDSLRTVLDAPLVTGGEVTGLLRIGASQPGAFAGEKERSFYTVANQVSLALERLAAQRRAERAHLASLAESLTDGIVLVDDALRITSLNAPAKALLAPIVGETASLAGTALEDMVRLALSEGRMTPARELESDASAAPQRYVSAMAAPLANSPEGSAAVVIVRDVTEERLMQERLLQSEKMVSVGQLVSGVAHELNNPLTGIMGFSQLLLGRNIDEQTKTDVQTIYTEAERAAKIVENLLDFARRKRAQKELANVNELLRRVLELRTYDLRVKNIEPELDLDRNLPETMVDANQIQQVLFNVIVNAEQAMITAHGRGKLKVRSRRKDGMIELSFADDGPGIEPETLRRIFDPFFTTKDTGEGTGLGLTISYGIIDEHGGRIWADSRPGRGTTFYIELPVVQGATEQAAGPVEQEPEASVAARSVLVVDDEESIQRLLGSILQMDGHHVDTARNGREALERIERTNYDLVITDIKMPDMDGRALHARLEQINPRLAQRTIFITGDTVSRDTSDFLQRVTNFCLAKPFKVREVRETIARIFDQ
ncbi:MAG: ATP-binding protein [Dehalococcoidia bacterium]